MTSLKPIYEFVKGDYVSEKVLIRSLTIFIPLSSEAFSSKTIYLKEGPYNYFAHATMVEVLPVPGDPYISKLGKLFEFIYFISVSTMYLCEIRFSIFFGRYFSIQGPIFYFSFSISILLRF